MVEHSGKSLTDRRVRDSEFPIFNSGPDYRRLAPRKMRGMSRTARATVERLQPYHRRKNPGARVLWMLHELTSIDKHRLPLVTASVLARSRFRIRGSGGPFTLHGIEVFPGPLEEDAIIARFHVDLSPDTNVNVDAELVSDIVFDHRSPARSVRGRSVEHTLWEIAEFIHTEVMPPLMPEIGVTLSFPDESESP